MFIVGFIVLACINFMNPVHGPPRLTITKEIGVRKRLVQRREKALCSAYPWNHFVYVLSSIWWVFRVASVYLLKLNPFTRFQESLTASMRFQPVFIAGFIAFMIIIGLLAGSYPALPYSPARLKGKPVRSRSSGIRNTLVVFKVFISIALIISSIMVYHQLKYLPKTVGFNQS